MGLFYKRFELKIYKNSVNGLNTRISGTALRFLMPLYIMAFSSESELGMFYLATALLTSAATFIGLEFGYYYSAIYLSTETEQKKDIFNNFVIQGARIGLLVIIVGFLSILVWLSISTVPTYLILSPILFVSEALSFEVGRFFWNIDEVKHASFRDLIKSIALVFSIVGSLYLFDTILSLFSVITLIFVNFSLLLYEINRWGDLNSALNTSFIVRSSPINAIKIFIKKLLAVSGPQFLQNQIISFSLLAEKVIITTVIGIGFQGVYSFAYSIVQTSASLFLSPHVAETRRIIISDQPKFLNKSTYRAALRLYPIVVVFMAIFGIFGYFALPILGELLNKDPVENILLIILVVIVSSSTNTYTAAVSALYGQRNRWVKANLVSIIILTPLILGSFIYKYVEMDGLIFVFVLIVFSSIMQIIVRLFFLGSKRAQ
jgi:hypothetical protein